MEQVLAILKIKNTHTHTHTHTGLLTPFSFNVDSNRKILRGKKKAILRGTEKDLTFSYPHANQDPAVPHTNIDPHQCPAGKRACSNLGLC